MSLLDEQPFVRLPPRLRVAVPGAVAVVLGGLLDPGVLAGPWSAAWALPGQDGWLAVQLLSTAALLAHPLRPRPATAWISLAGWASWLFWGLAVATVGV